MPRYKGVKFPSKKRKKNNRGINFTNIGNASNEKADMNENLGIGESLENANMSSTGNSDSHSSETSSKSEPTNNPKNVPWNPDYDLIEKYYSPNPDDYPSLVVENMTPLLILSSLTSLNGRRIVNIEHFIREVIKLAKHSTVCAKGGSMSYVKEIRFGLESHFVFQCSKPQCAKIIKITSNPTDTSKSNVNYHAAWGFISVGAGHAQQDEVLSLLGVPSMSHPTFYKYETLVGTDWAKLFGEQIQETGFIEADIARKAGRVDKDGIPWVKVIGDGGWGTRSYGHRYSANCGVAVIIGFETKKLLFLGVRNKYCSICNTAQRKGTDIEHTCYKNWNGSSTAMEADIIVEGFRKSVEMHGVRYKEFVGDGDSSVMAKIREKVDYGHTVQKVECSNHAVRRFAVCMYALAKENSQNTRFLSKGRILRLKKAVKGAIRHNATTGQGEQALKKDLMNVANHVYGEHKGCRDYFCGPKKDNVKTLNILKTVPFTLLVKITAALEVLCRKAGRLLSNDTSNAAETYMNVMSKFIGHKQFCRSRRNSYGIRSFGAGLSYQLGAGSFHEKMIRVVQDKSPFISVKQFASHTSKLRAAARRYKSRLETKKERTTKKVASIVSEDADYGANAAEPDMPQEVFEREKKEFLTKLSVVDRVLLEKNTRGQSENERWKEERRIRLTGSNFGKICKMKETTSCAATIKRLLYGEVVICPSMEYGKKYEQEAIKEYKKLRGLEVQPCGLYVDEEFPYLAASPDGRVETKKGPLLLEVKCPANAEKKSFSDLAKEKKAFCSEELSAGKFALKRNNDYYFQVQGQMRVSKIYQCDFILWSPTEIFVERIFYDEAFWAEKMQFKLCRFYEKAILPELVDPRSFRSLKLREPEYVVLAQKAVETRPKPRARRLFTEDNANNDPNINSINIADAHKNENFFDKTNKLAENKKMNTQKKGKRQRKK